MIRHVKRKWKIRYSIQFLAQQNNLQINKIHLLHSDQHAFSPIENRIKSQLPLSFGFLQRNEKKNFPSSFHPSPHLDFEINFSPGSSETISTLKMSQVVEILISDLVFIVN